MVTNNNKTVDTKQIWQQMEPAPVVSGALSAMTTSEDGLDRFIYYLIGATFFRYDTIGNTWHKLAAPLLTPTVFVSMRFSKYGGTHGKVISCPSATTLRIAPLNAQFLVNDTIRITHGTGAGQVRTITASPEPTKYDQGLATAASATALTDSTKKWKVNQWVGYQARITFGTGATQVRRILYNDATAITFSDTNHQSIDSWNNTGFAVAPVVTAGLQAHYVIEATDITVASWTTNPDASSRFKIETGGLWLFTSAATPNFFSIQYYDIAGDFWLAKTQPSGLVAAAFSTDGTIERTGEIGGIYESGTATSGTDYRIVDTSKAFTFSKYINYRVRITGGTGIGQQRRIVCSGTDYFEVARKWDTNPSIDSTYEVIADKDKIYMAGNAHARMLQYDVDSDLVLQGAKYDDGIANVMAARHVGIEQQPFAITSGTRLAAGVASVNATPTAGGSGYLVGDVLTCSVGGTGAQVIVTSVSPGGIVTGIELVHSGTATGFVSGAGKATTGGTGTACTINITAGVTSLVTCALTHNFKTGDQVIISGCDEGAWNTQYAIIGCPGLTTFCMVTTATAAMVATTALSATVHVDTTKNWTVNEHAGKILQCHLVGITGVVTPRTIISNTATTITTATITTAMVAGTGRYVIVAPSAFGRDEERRASTESADGHATSGTATSLVDNTKNWISNKWVGYKVRVDAGTGRDYTMTITSNDSTTLNYSAPGFTPNATTHYHIQDTYGVCSGAGSTTTIVDTTKNWAVNQWAGKRLQITGGAGFALTAATNEIAIVSNTATVLTFAAITGFAPDATTTYTILGTPIRSTGIELIWMYGGASAGRYMFLPRGGASNTADRYDITTEKYEYAMFFSPETDTLTSGTYYAYDGSNRVYFSPGVATGIVQYVYYFDLLTNRVFGFGSVPNTQLAPTIGNRMEIITSPQGIDYLYHMRNTGAEVYRAMIWF